jgi:hypothetical protein
LGSRYSTIELLPLDTRIIEQVGDHKTSNGPEED